MKAKDLRTKAHTCYASSSSGKEIRRTDPAEMTEEVDYQLRTKKIETINGSLIIRHPKEKVTVLTTGLASEIS
jgi:hypothetical protein